MATTTRPRPAPPAAPFPPAPPAPPAPPSGSRWRDTLAALGSLLALGALLLGLPVLLALLVGWPLPDRVPTGSELLETVRSPITDQMLVNALACIFWIVWLQIVVCTVVEVRAAVKGVGVPRRVPLAGVTQHLTRKLVSTVLLLVTVTAVLSPVTAAVTRAVLPEAPAAASVSAPATVADSATAPVPAPVVQQQAPTAGVGQLSEPDPRRLAGELAGRKVLIVEPPEGRHHMSLWEIAERHLGDGLRYKEIFALNEHRDQPGGGHLHQARLIQPGWQLLLPDNATGVPTVPESPAAPVQAPVPVGSAVAAGGGGAAEAGGAAAERPDTGTATTEGSERLDSESPLVSVLALAEAGLLSVGLLAGIGQLRRVQQRRRRDGERLPVPPAELVRAEMAMRLGEDPEAVQALDHALRLLSESQSAALAPLPDVVAAVVDADTLRLVLAEPTRPVPAPFTAVDPLGGSWQAARDTLPDTCPGALSPYPALVTVGSDVEGGRLLVDLEAVGVLALSGPRRGTTAVLRAIAVELATSGWADHLQLTLVGFGEQLQALQPVRVRHVATLAEALPGLEARHAAFGQHADGPAGVLHSRMEGADPLMPELVLIAEQHRPDAQVLRRLRALAAGLQRRNGLAMVTSEDVPEARWQLRVAADGSAVVQPLGARLLSRGLDDDAWTAVTRLVALAAAPILPSPAATPPAVPADAESTTEASPLGPPRLPSLADVTSAAVAGAAGPVSPLRLVLDDDGGDLPPAGAAGEVRILGPVDVDIPGAGPAPHAHCVELVVLLALHPEGLDLPAVAAAMRPSDDPADAARATQVLVARTRSWLGADALGQQLLPRRRSGGPLQLSPALTLDWDRFRAVTTGRAPAGPAAFELIRGPVLSGLPARRYTWLVPTGLEQEIPSAVVDAATSAARARFALGDAKGAGVAAAAGLRADRLDERLWRELLRAEASLGDLDRVEQLAEELEWLVDQELWPYDGLQPETIALVESLLPRGPERVAR